MLIAALRRRTPVLALVIALSTAFAVLASSLPAFGTVEPDTAAVETHEQPTDIDSEAADPLVDDAPVSDGGVVMSDTRSSAARLAPVAAGAPTISVSKTEGLVSGEVITVSGENFGPVPPATTATRFPLAGSFGGVYVVFGSYAEVWKPSEGAGSAARKAAPGQTRWVVNPENVATIGGANAGGVAIEADGSFEVELTVTDEFVGMLENGRLGVYTFPGGGASYAPFETETLLAFAPPAPTISVSKTEGLVAGEVITVSGENFGPVPPATTATRFPLAGSFGGVYVVFGSYAEVWKPSEGAGSAARKAAPGQTRWVVNPENVATIGGANAGGVAIEADGSFEVELTVTDEFEGMLENGRLGVYTFPGGGASYAPFETATLVEFAGPVIEPEPEPEPEVTVPPATPTPSAGTLRWGVKESFRNYVTGSIAQGTIRVSGASSDGSVVVFPQTSATGATDTIAYGGSVRYSGHSGALDVTIASPTVRLVSSTRGELVATVNGSRVTLATLSLANGARTVLPDGAVRYSGVPATLTAAGAPAFAYGGTAFYPAGTALDAVTFTIGAPSSASGAARVVSAYTGSSIPTTPPASTGAELQGDDPNSLQPGQRITVSAGGFAANETGIAVVIYSEPLVLSQSVTADASGVATWTGTLPADLVGVHTLTLQGSVDRGIVVTIRELAQTVSLAGSCLVSDAELEWGFKEAFRAYISGSIANGEWQLLEGAEYETPSFAFGGAGAINPRTGEGQFDFTGGIRFTGHGGILDTTVSNPRVVMIDGDTAQLVLDVIGTTQDGVAVEAEGVVFGDIDLSAAARSADDGVLTITGAPVTLTATGADAFGTYPAGEEFDPITITGTLADDCGDELVASPEAEAPATSDGAIEWWVWALLIAAVLAVITVVIVMLRRRAAA
ncbi:MAG: HtaA domain-containing protein [Microcella sp.]|uniref:HtaA domain-containing protein n=1 Tax=Microcella sp. TaxID=1913979 RepID=UPI0024C6C2DF|nr:HtaA domain-containing protein [Microcella sp.]UYN83427.1 MAG: HtaA domain-containing protein [Microcella sp.]